MAFSTTLAYVKQPTERMQLRKIDTAVSDGTASSAAVLPRLINRRVRGDPLPARRWDLGQTGLPLNIISLCLNSVVFVFVLFPQTTPVTVGSMDYAVVMFLGIMFLGIVYYFVHGKNVYVAPVALVKR